MTDEYTDNVVDQNDLKAFLKIMDDGNIVAMERCASAAQGYLEDYTGKAFSLRLLKLTLDAFPASIQLPRGPVQEIVSIKYLDADRVEQTLAAGNYFAWPIAVDQPTIVCSASNTTWPTTADVPSAVTIEYEAGYECAPEPLVHAVLMLAGHLFENREGSIVGVSIQEIVPVGVHDLVRPYKAWAF